MKLKLSILILCFVINLSVLKSQSITNTHISPGITFPGLSARLGQVAWIDTSGMYYAHHELDSSFNITTFIHNDLLKLDTINNVLTGVYALNGSYDHAGNYWGLFFDVDRYIDSVSAPNGMVYYGDDCYFLYDFANNQRHDFTINTNNLIWHTPLEDMATMMLNNGDTLVVTLYNYSYGGLDNYYVISNSKFINGAMVASSGLVNNPSFSNFYFFAETYFDLNHKQHMLFASDNSFLDDKETDYINYNNGTYTYPFNSINCNFLIDSLGALHKYINNPFGDTIRLETSIDTTFIPVPFEDDSILWNRNSAHCVDHLNRNWVLRSNELYMFDGTNWLDINSNMMPFKINYPLTSFNQWYYRTFAEFATNKFVIGNKHFRPNHQTANGFYVFTYIPAIVGIKEIKVSNVNLSVNHSLSSIIVNNTDHVQFYELYDMNGKMISTNNNSNSSFSIDATGFQSGMYILKCVQKDHRVESIKFVW